MSNRGRVVPLEQLPDLVCQLLSSTGIQLTNRRMTESFGLLMCALGCVVVLHEPSPRGWRHTLAATGIVVEFRPTSASMNEVL